MLRLSTGLALLLALGPGCKKKAPLRAEGVVVDALSGKPMEGILVSSFQIGGGDTVSQTTGSDGAFTLRGKFDPDRPYQLKAESKRTVTVQMLPAPRLPYSKPVRMPVLPNDVPNGFNIPSGGVTVKAPMIDAKVTLPPADRPTAPLSESIESKDVPANIPPLVVGDKPVTVILAPPAEHCACAVQKLVPTGADGGWQTDGEMIQLETWQPDVNVIMPTIMMHILQIPPGKLSPGRWVFWPTTPPAYEVMARLPKVFRQGYLFDVPAK